MECSFAITGKDYAIFASDSVSARSIMKMKVGEDKMKEITKYQVMSYTGESGDTVQFAEYVERNIRLNSIRNHTELRPHAAASWVRKTLADSLRSRSPYQVNLLIGGYDHTTGKPEVYWIDYLGTLAKVPYAAHGYGQYFSLSTLDRYHHPNLNFEEGIELLKRCIGELRTRFLLDLGKKWTVRVADAQGVRLIDVDLSSLDEDKGKRPEGQ